MWGVAQQVANEMMKGMPMNRLARSLVHVLAFVVVLSAGPAAAAEWFASPQGTPDARGAKDSPWDLASALGGRQKIAPGDTLWILPGTYKHPDRRQGSAGYEVRLAGREDRPIHVRGMPGARVTIDGGLSVVAPSTFLWVRDLEILVSENFTMSRTIRQSGSSPGDYGRPWGGLHVHAGKACKFINLVIHDNAQGISLWSGATDTEVYGCLIYDNGWKAPDRGHGHAIYTQNQNGVKTISDCIMTGGYGYTMHAYGSSRAYVDHYLATRNVCYDAGPFLVGGGRPSRDIRVVGNLLYKVPMQIGYAAPYNEDCEVRDNVIVGARLEIKNYRKAVNEGNFVIGPNEHPVFASNEPRPGVRTALLPNRYDPQRANVAIFNWAKQPAVDLDVTPLLKPGEAFRLLDPRDFFGKPLVEGTVAGNSIRVPMSGEFAAMVLVNSTTER